MASRGYDRDGSQHDAVVSNLMDLQARLRGDPASLVLPREGRRDDPTTVRRLEYLELEIDAYEHVAAEAQDPQPATPIKTDVGELQHVVEERLMTPEQDDVATEEPTTP
jgi:hypothetical protein